MKEPDGIFQSVSPRRKIIISIGMLTILVIVIGLYGLAAIVESNQRLHRSVLEGQTMAKAIDTARLAQVHLKQQVQEWKNILLRGQEKDLFDKHLKAFDEEDRKTNEYLKSLLQIADKAKMTVPQIVNAIHKHEKLGKQYREVLAKYKPLDTKNAALIDKSIRGIDRELTDEIDAIVDIVKNLTEQKLRETELIAKIRMEAYRALAVFIIFLMIAAVAFGIFNIISITRDLSLENKKNGTEPEDIQ